jgi:replicative DNA helicase
MLTAELKEIAKECKCPVLVGSQLNRGCEFRGATGGDFRPFLSDLRESGNLEQDADVVLMVSRHEVHRPGQRVNEVDIGIVKNRNGKTGWERFSFFGYKTAFQDSALDEDPI